MTTAKADCGCGCGGAPATPSAFVRPRFFAGQLLTEDDLSLLVDYVAGKDRLHNRMLLGPGVVCGLEVTCEPCGGGMVAVRPGHALDCCGNDIVVSCKEKVDVAALVRDLRVSSLGVRCDDPCDDGRRRFGLFVRYEESSVDPVTPFATEESCPTPGCVPSRVQEGFRFVVRYDTTDDHRFNPGTKLLNAIGSLDRYDQVHRRAQRFGFYADPMVIAASVTAPVTFGDADATRYSDSLAWLEQNGGTVPTTPRAAVEMTEQVRALASAIARYDTHDEDGQRGLREAHSTLDTVDGARGTLGSVCGLLIEADTEKLWPGPVHRSVALAVVRETRARVVDRQVDAPNERRLLAMGTPVDNVLAVEFRSDLVLIREWLLRRLDDATGLGDCALRDDVLAVAIPQPLPVPEPDPADTLSPGELHQLGVAAGRLATYVRRFVTDAACSTLNPPCTDCADTDVLLAHLELDGCDVVRVCSATREQVLPGGSAYGEWLPKLYRLRELAERVCCEPLPVYRPPSPEPDEPVSRPYAEGLLRSWRSNDDLDRMWSLLITPAPGETPPKPIHEQVYTVPAEVTDSMQELNVLRSQVGDLVATVEALRSQLDAARDQVSQVRDDLPERLGERLSELESAPQAEPDAEQEPEPEPKPPARRRSSSTRARSDGRSTPKPKSGESS
jgi:hypothetical protein